MGMVISCGGRRRKVHNRRLRRSARAPDGSNAPGLLVHSLGHCGGPSVKRTTSAANRTPEGTSSKRSRFALAASRNGYG